MARAAKKPAADPAAKNEAKPSLATGAASQEPAASSSLAAGSAQSPGAGAAPAVSAATPDGAGAPPADGVVLSQSGAASNDKPEEQRITPPEAAASGGTEAPREPSAGARLFADRLEWMKAAMKTVFHHMREMAHALGEAREDEYDALRRAYSQVKADLGEEGDAAFEMLALARPADPANQAPVLVRARTRDGKPMHRAGVRWGGDWSTHELTPAHAERVFNDPGLEAKVSEVEPPATA